MQIRTRKQVQAQHELTKAQVRFIKLLMPKVQGSWFAVRGGRFPSTLILKLLIWQQNNRYKPADELNIHPQSS